MEELESTKRARRDDVAQAQDEWADVYRDLEELYFKEKVNMNGFEMARSALARPTHSKFVFDLFVKCSPGAFPY